MWSITYCVFPSVEYLHSMICICLLPRYVGSGMSCPLELVVYPMGCVWCVVGRSVLWWEDIFWYGLWVVCCVWLVILEAFLLRVEDLWEFCCRVLCNILWECFEVFGRRVAKVEAYNRPSSSAFVL